MRFMRASTNLSGDFALRFASNRKENIMPQSTHERAAELHNLAAHAHAAAAESHGKADHLTAHELSQQALEHSQNAHRQSQQLFEEAEKPSKE
jgi:L-aminopeptidase/D-esterase-like protein